MASSRAMMRELRRDLASKSELEAKAAPKAVAPKVDAIQEAEKAADKAFVAWREACNHVDKLKAASAKQPQWEEEEAEEVELSCFNLKGTKYVRSQYNECWLYDTKTGTLGAWAGIYVPTTGMIKPAPEPLIV